MSDEEAITSGVLSVLGPTGAATIAVFLLKGFISDTKTTIKELSEKLSASETRNAEKTAELKSAVEHLIKDLTKIEALAEHQANRGDKLRDEFAELRASTTAIWSVLKKKFPDEVPKRIIDDK